MLETQIMTAEPGTQVLAYGYEAVARGAFEANVKLVSGFPGSPASGALEALASIAVEEDMHVEWSTNEKVALEAAWGAAMNGQRAMCVVNHLGANVIADPLKHSVNYGVTGGLVLFVGDDIGANTSAIEADSRQLAHSANMPVLTPSTHEEALEMTKRAFEISEELGCPVMLRSVCQLMMSKTAVRVGKREKTSNESGFAPNPRRVVMFESGVMPAVTIHRFMYDNLSRAGVRLSGCGYDRLELKQDAKVGLIACGALYRLAKEAIRRIGASEYVSVLKLGVVNPLNEELTTELLRSVSGVLVLEEGEPYVEGMVMEAASKRKTDCVISGRLDGTVPFGGELFLHGIMHALAAVLRRWNVEFDASQIPEVQGGGLQERTLTLCAGCSHLGAFYALRQAFSYKTGGEYVAVSDAGCAFMGILNPAKTLNSATDMGGAIGLASGVALSGSEVPVIAVVGDGGFIHGGINALINAVYNNAEIIVVILNNGTLGNTGLQSTACTGRNAVNAPSVKIRLEELCKAAGVPFVRSADPYKVDDMVDAIKEAANAPKPAVIVANQVCVLNRGKEGGGSETALVQANIEYQKCTRCMKCMQLYCAALSVKNVNGEQTRPEIDGNICSGCGMCKEICQQGAITMAKTEVRI